MCLSTMEIYLEIVHNEINILAEVNNKMMNETERLKTLAFELQDRVADIELTLVELKGLIKK